MSAELSICQELVNERNEQKHETRANDRTTIKTKCTRMSQQSEELRC